VYITRTCKPESGYLNLSIEKLARRCLLSLEDVKLWLDHLKQAQNRKQGAEKAKVTRQKNKSKR
jgi:hypothetical protein